MLTDDRHILWWAPRILGFGFAAFLGVFALDVFEEGGGFGATATALLIHVIPVYIVLATLLVAWRWPRPGGMIFLLLAAAYVVMMPLGRLHWSAPLLIAGPAVLIGLLFLREQSGRIARPVP